MKILGIVLIILGAVALAYKGFSYNKQHEVLRLGEHSITATTKERVNVPIWAGFLLLGGGVALVMMGKKKS